MWLAGVDRSRRLPSTGHNWLGAWLTAMHLAILFISQFRASKHEKGETMIPSQGNKWTFSAALPTLLASKSSSSIRQSHHVWFGEPRFLLFHTHQVICIHAFIICMRCPPIREAGEPFHIYSKTLQYFSPKAVISPSFALHASLKKLELQNKT